MKSTIYKLALILTAAVVAGNARAASPDADSIYSLRQCRELAVKNNAAIITSARNLEAAQETRKEAFTKYFPEISAGASAFWANHDMIQYTVLDLFTLGVIKNGKAAGVWAVQPVFMGGQIVNGNKLAAVGEEAARIRKDQAADDVLVATDDLYWKLVSLKALRTTVVNAIEMLDSLVSDVGAAVEAGIVVRNDLLKAELKRNEYRNSLIDLDNGIGLMKKLLSQQMGLGVTAAIDVEEDVPEALPACPDSIYTDSGTAVYDTSDRRLLEKNVESKVLEKRMKVGEYLPKVGVGAGWFYHDIFDQNHNFGAVMLTVDVPISAWWGGSHSIRKKNIELENARTELNDLSQKLEIEISDKWDNLTGAYRKMQIAHQDIDQSAENLRITKAYYEAGMNTITDLLDAQTLHVKSQGEYISSYGAFRTSISQYLNATGRL